MTSLYEQLFDDIPLFVVPGTENSDVIEYETNEQRNARLLNEARIKQQMDEIERLRMQIKHVGLAYGSLGAKVTAAKDALEVCQRDWRTDEA